MGTDQDWEFYGATRPYYGVLTESQYNRQQLDAETKHAFFESGEAHVAWLFSIFQEYFGEHIKPRHAVDFGCGVGRIVVPLASRCHEVTGLDVSPSMLKEATENCRSLGVSNVAFALSDDELAQLSRPFDLLHSCIVFQHIPPERGKRIYVQLLDRLAPGGYGAVQFTYGKTRRWSTLRALAKRLPFARQLYAACMGIPFPTATMQMNAYHLGWLVEQLQLRGIRSVRLELSQHLHSLATYLIFRKPS